MRVNEIPCSKRHLHYWRFRELALLTFRAWRRTLGDEPLPDLVLVWGGLPLGVLLFGQLSGSPSVVALRGSDVPGFSTRTSNPFWRFLARKVWGQSERITANSPSLARLVRNTDRTVPLEIIPNGVSLAPWSQVKNPSAQLADPNREWVVLTVSRLVRRKRVEWLIQALALLAEGDLNRVRLVIVGDGPERYRLETMARELAVSRRVEFRGEVPPHKVNEAYAEADIFALPSSAEGLSNALLEAMSFGLPCVTAEPTGFPDIDGATINAHRKEKYSQIIRLLMRSPEEYAKASTQARAVVEHYTWESVANSYLEVFDEIMREARGERSSGR